MPHDVKKYGESLRELRRWCDYRYESYSRNQEVYKKDLSDIVSNGDRVFLQLSNKVRSDYKKFFGQAMIDETITVEDCDAIMNEIEELNKTLTDMMIR